MGTAIISEKFDKKSLGKAIGIHYGVAYLGNIIGPLSVASLIAFLGWRRTLFVFSIPTFVVGLVVIWYLRGDKATRPEDSSESPTNLRLDVVKLIRTPTVIPIILTQALLSGGIDLGIITTYMPLFLADALKIDVHSYLYGLTYTIALLGGVCGPIILGKYADKIGHLKMAAFSALLALSMVYLLVFHESANLLLAPHLFLLGLASFALPTLLQSHLVNITRQYNRDLVIGVFFTVGFGFGSLWSGIIGYMIDVYSSFKPALILMGTLGIIAFLVLVQQLRTLQQKA
jgi:predicted MFS family arabinose efflux permease